MRVQTLPFSWVWTHLQHPNLSRKSAAPSIPTEASPILQGSWERAGWAGKWGIPKHTPEMQRGHAAVGVTEGIRSLQCKGAACVG